MFIYRIDDANSPTDTDGLQKSSVFVGGFLRIRIQQHAAGGGVTPETGIPAKH
jgi:hypothetical protein